MSEKQSLAGQTIVMSGASSGFGRGAAEQLGALGANVVLVARRGELLDQIGMGIVAAGGAALAVPADMSEPDAATHVMEQALDRFGSVDVWVNNVGVGALGFFWDIPVDDQARVVDVNVKSVLYGSHAAIRQFRTQGAGTLINIGSVDSSVPLAYQTTYAATKAAVLSLGRSLTEELRLDGSDDTIKVGTIMPYAIDTPWWTHAANYTGHAPRMAVMDDPQLVVDAILRACVDPKDQHPVGPKASFSVLSHSMFPKLTERLTGKLVDAEVEKGAPVPSTTGAIYEPMAGTTTIEGGVRERMRREDELAGQSKG